MSGFLPVDHAARERARADHATSLVLEAGAGTGKTTLLVDRIEALLRSGRARLDEIAAVTFTENAATSMKLRLRERLERARAEAALPAAERERVSRALDVIERASVSTIHALCARILQERPLECGVVPGFQVADEALADALFAAAWEEWLGERLAGGDDVLLDALDRGIPLEGVNGWGERSSLRGLARTLVEQRDLEPLLAERPFAAEAARAELLEQGERARALAALGPGGRQPRRAAPAARRARRGRALPRGRRARAAPARARGDPGQLRLQAELALGRGARRGPGDRRLDEGGARGAGARRAGPRCTAASCAALRDVVALYERRKAQRGVLDFLDLLLKTRDALRDQPGAARTGSRGASRCVLIDEFQDTDPLQVEIAAAARGAAAGRRSWWWATPSSRSTASGAPRCACSASWSRARRRRRDGAVLHLVQNFRSRPGDPALREPRLRRADPGLGRGRPAAVRADRAAARAAGGALRRRAALPGAGERGGRGPARGRGRRPRDVPRARSPAAARRCATR